MTTVYPVVRKSNVDNVRVIQVIEVRSIFGEGTEVDPVRQVVEFFSIDGELLARVDPETQKQINKATETKQESLIPVWALRSALKKGACYISTDGDLAYIIRDEKWYAARYSRIAGEFGSWMEIERLPDGFTLIRLKD